MKCLRCEKEIGHPLVDWKTYRSVDSRTLSDCPECGNVMEICKQGEGDDSWITIETLGSLQI
jgi:DNA-directed RNA polymerase subunit RPC12/RpoP